jgi:3-hydroxyacyl-CoA dehydrogenase
VHEEPTLPSSAAVVGCGVIGAGWVSRFALNGCDVRVVDPSPATRSSVDEVLANAAAAWDGLGLDRPPPGDVAVVESVAAAVEGAGFVQESVPERLELKRSVLSEIEAAADPGATIASSTSGLRPTELQADMERPGRFVVGHPFNPVYLLPLVEVVAGERTELHHVERAERVYDAIGMHPLRVRVEVDAFIADRLMEALWREALWLVHDGVATAGEIDTAITRGFGVRWAQMGLFETFRVAGGSGGFGHFLEQFGPALALPWTKLSDVPDLDEELIDAIVTQTDEHTGAEDVRDAERRRDANLVAILGALEQRGQGAGLDIATMRRRLARRVRT